MSGDQGSGHVLFQINEKAGVAFSWISVGLAVLTALLQGLVTAIAIMTEASSRWTFRFRLALWEHWWWTLVSLLLLVSLVMNALSFASGTGASPITVLTLSAATFLAMVQYMLPAWQDRHYTRTRWWAWTGDSRTAIPREKSAFCGDEKKWKNLIEENKVKLKDVPITPSDIYGWRLWPVGGIPYDPTDILGLVNDEPLIEEGHTGTGIYHSDDPYHDKVSLRWGRSQKFRRRVSRGVFSMPVGLLRSSPTTSDGYDGKGLAKAMGILGRNKGLRPHNLVFRMDETISTYMENNSTWTPRPAKVLRSFYLKTMETQFHGIGNAYVLAAVELALLMADIPYWAIDKWLERGLEHQSLVTNCFLAEEVLYRVPQDEKLAVLKAHYESSYVSMIISLNNMDKRMKNKSERQECVGRPDILCLGLLLKARGMDMPSWWNWDIVAARRKRQASYLDGERWKMPMARLLGLESFPEGFNDYPISRWGERQILPPVTDAVVVRNVPLASKIAAAQVIPNATVPLMAGVLREEAAGIELQEMNAAPM